MNTCVKGTIRAILEQFTPLFEDLSHRRAEVINETSAMRRFTRAYLNNFLTYSFSGGCDALVETHSAERYQSRRKLVKNAKARIEEDHERQRVSNVWIVCVSP